MVAWIVVLIVGWVAATISGAAGFGGALILLPMLTAVGCISSSQERYTK